MSEKSLEMVKRAVGDEIAMNVRSEKPTFSVCEVDDLLQFHRDVRDSSCLAEVVKHVRERGWSREKTLRIILNAFGLVLSIEDMKAFFQRDPL